MTMNDGSRDFDFLHGAWDVAHHYRRAPDSPWQDFHSHCTTMPILGGLGNLDLFHADVGASGQPWDATTVRLYVPATSTWRIWWAASTLPGQLQAPMAGRFTGGLGLFFDEGPPPPPGNEHTRFQWTHDSESKTARWEQAIRPTSPANLDDDWATTWTMTFTNRKHLPEPQ